PEKASFFLLKTLQPQGLKRYKRTDFRAEIVTLVSRKEKTRFFAPDFEIVFLFKFIPKKTPF
ncbi:hypothetical protein, partial [Bacillus mycoides]|uniref:hypothetical protein n=1 Tax=Bacillus mycoides TaxID=1405 RepID=UPI003A80E41B